MRLRPFTASGRLSRCNRTGRKPPSCRPTRVSSRRSATSSGSTWRRPSAQWCCAATRIADPDLRPHPTFVADPRPGQAERSHDDTRHGTLSLFAALDTATGRVIGRCSARHRGREFRAFINTIETNVPDDLDVHIVLDNLASHKTQAIRNWFAKKRSGPPPHEPTYMVHRPVCASRWMGRAVARATERSSIRSR